MIKSQIKQDSLLFSAEANLQSTLIQPLNLNLNKKNSENNKSGIKPKPSTDRTNMNSYLRDSNSNINQFIKNLQENNFFQNSQNKTERQILLQKRKSYAQSIRQKNKQAKKTNQNQSMNVSYAFTPPKDYKMNQNSISQVQKQYYSSRKYVNEMSNSKVFKEINPNKQNTNVFAESDSINRLNKSGLCVKTSNIMNATNLDTINSSTNRDSYHSSRKNINNKQNKNIIPVSNKKNSNQKPASYAEIFDKKTTMNTLINHQKGKATGNSASRNIINSIKKDKSSLKSMATPQGGYQFGNHQFSTNLDNLQCSVNGFTVEQYDRIEDISRIDQIGVEKGIKTQTNEIQQIPKRQLKLSLQSNIVFEVVDFTQEYERIRKQQEKQIVALAKQNTTFKRDLAQYRKQNSTVKKQLQKCQKYIKELEQKAKLLLLQQQKWQINNKLINQQTNQKNQQNLNDHKQQKSSQINCWKASKQQDANNNLQQILESTQQQLFCLRSNNKALQLKVYMLQKKLVHQQQLSKKRLALQVNNWKQKYNKLRNENIRMKHNQNQNRFLNSDFSLSMDISRDE